MGFALIKLFRQRYKTGLLRNTDKLCIPAFIISIVIPVIVLRITVFHNEEMAQVLLNTQSYDDYYSLIKMLCLLLATILLFIIFAHKRDTEKQIHKSLLLLIPYVACILLSVIYSDYKISSAFGIVDHYEGALTQLCYCFVLVFFYYLVDNTSIVITIFKMLCIGSFIVAFIGLLQFIGILYTERPYEISSTIGNSNYVGTYAALLVPITFALILIETDKIKKVLNIIIYFGAAFFLLVGSQSRAGYIAFAVTTLLFLILMWGELKKQLKWFFATVFYGVIIFILMSTYSNGVIWNEVQSLNPLKQEVHKGKLIFEDVIIYGTNVEVKTNKWILNLEYTNEGFIFYNEDMQHIPHKKDNNAIDIHFLKEPYQEISVREIKNEDYTWIMLEVEGKDIEFVYVNDKLKVVGFNGKVTDIEAAESFGFTGKESFASGRGYIWSRSIPLLKKAIFIGYGPDTFIYIFPQNDIVGKLNYGAIWAIISKPHNWYLQIALGYGVLSLICILALIIWLLVNALMFIYRNVKTLTPSAKVEGVSVKYSDRRIIVSAIILSVAGYCITGVFNDSIVAVSPIFWMLLGMGIRQSSLKL